MTIQLSSLALFSLVNMPTTAKTRKLLFMVNYPLKINFM